MGEHIKSLSFFLLFSLSGFLGESQHSFMLVQGMKLEGLNAPGFKTHLKPLRVFAVFPSISKAMFCFHQRKKQKDLFSFLSDCYQDLANFIFEHTYGNTEYDTFCCK